MTRIVKRENELKIAFWKHFAKQYDAHQAFVMSLQDVRKSGYPDSCVNSCGKTTWWEFKHATPNFESPAIQEITCLRLAKHSFCRYVLFFEYQEQQKIFIVHPRDIAGCEGKASNIIKHEHLIEGFDFVLLAQYIYDTNVWSHR